jgi:hypothetical protein
MTIAAGGSSDEAITRLAKGTLISDDCAIVKPAAFIMALPAVLATYSSSFLLLGLITMVVAGPRDGIDTQVQAYALVTMVPVGIGLSFLCVAIIVCEVGYWIEVIGRRKHAEGRPASVGQVNQAQGSSTFLTFAPRLKR